MQFAGTNILLENLSRIAPLRHETYCLIAPRTLAARLEDRDLTAPERDRMQCLRLQAGRDRFLVAHTLTRRVLACLSRCNTSDFEMIAGKQGKPMLKDGSLYFNISYADDWIAVIVTSCGPVGIDLEYPAPQPETLCSNELPVEMMMNPADLFQPRPSDPTQRFYTCWTLKEAISKADGRGLNLAFESIRLKPQGDGIYCGSVDTNIWRARHLQLADGTHLAHACKIPLDPIYLLVR